MKVKGMLLRRNGVHDVLVAAGVPRSADTRSGLQRSARCEQRGHHFVHHLNWDGFSRTTSFTRRLRNDVRRARGAHRRLRPLKRRRRAERDVVRCLDRERSRPARWVRRWLCGAVGCRPSAVVDVRRERAWRAHRVLCRGQLRSLAERDGARRRARERERPAGGAQRASHIWHAMSMSVYGKAAGVRAPCGVSSLPIHVF